MLRFVLSIVVLAAVGVLLAAPVPAETRKPAAFPAGHYILTGAGEPAQGTDVYEFTKTFRLKPGQYILSGGEKPTDSIVIDDDLEVHQGDKKLFIDDDQVASTDRRGKRAASYQGQPIVLVLDPTKKVRIVGIDHFATEAIISELWLHRWDGARKKLSDRRREQSAPLLPNTFFDESFALDEGFKMPENVATDAAIDVPEKPATLLPRFKSPAPPAPVRAETSPTIPDTSEFIETAVVNGLTEDGVPPTLATELSQRDDFLPKCPLCRPSQDALRRYAELKKAPTPKEGRGLSEEFVKRLRSDDNDTRQPALRELVKRYIEREYARVELTAEQKTRLASELESLRKDSMRGLPKGKKFCPSCDGVCRVGSKLH